MASASALRASSLLNILRASLARRRAVPFVTPVSRMCLSQLVRASLLIDNPESPVASRLSEDSTHFVSFSAAAGHVCQEKRFSDPGPHSSRRYLGGGWRVDGAAPPNPPNLSREPSSPPAILILGRWSAIRAALRRGANGPNRS